MGLSVLIRSTGTWESAGFYGEDTFFFNCGDGGFIEVIICGLDGPCFQLFVSFLPLSTHYHTCLLYTYLPPSVCRYLCETQNKLACTCALNTPAFNITRFGNSVDLDRAAGKSIVDAGFYSSTPVGIGTYLGTYLARLQGKLI